MRTVQISFRVPLRAMTGKRTQLSKGRLDYTTPIVGRTRPSGTLVGPPEVAPFTTLMNSPKAACADAVAPAVDTYKV